MKIKTSELKGIQLDWAVAKCEGIDPYLVKAYPYDVVTGIACVITGMPYSPSTVWEQVGPIIEREKISMYSAANVWAAKSRFTDENWFREVLANTPLEAAMRCYVASKLGDEVEIPEVLV